MDGCVKQEDDEIKLTNEAEVEEDKMAAQMKTEDSDLQLTYPSLDSFLDTLERDVQGLNPDYVIEGCTNCLSPAIIPVAINFDVVSHPLYRVPLSTFCFQCALTPAEEVLMRHLFDCAQSNNSREFFFRVLGYPPPGERCDAQPIRAAIVRYRVDLAEEPIFVMGGAQNNWEDAMKDLSLQTTGVCPSLPTAEDIELNFEGLPQDPELVADLGITVSGEVVKTTEDDEDTTLAEETARKCKIGSS